MWVKLNRAWSRHRGEGQHDGVVGGVSLHKPIYGRFCGDRGGVSELRHWDDKPGAERTIAGVGATVPVIFAIEVDLAGACVISPGAVVVVLCELSCVLNRGFAAGELDAARDMGHRTSAGSTAVAIPALEIYFDLVAELSSNGRGVGLPLNWDGTQCIQGDSEIAHPSDPVPGVIGRCARVNCGLVPIATGYDHIVPPGLKVKRVCLVVCIQVTTRGRCFGEYQTREWTIEPLTAIGDTKRAGGEVNSLSQAI